MISRSPVHKLLEIKLLQNALYGRLAVDGSLLPEAVRGVLNGRSPLEREKWSYTLGDSIYRIGRREGTIDLGFSRFFVQWPQSFVRIGARRC